MCVSASCVSSFLTLEISNVLRSLNPTLPEIRKNRTVTLSSPWVVDMSFLVLKNVLVSPVVIQRSRATVCGV